MRKFQSLVGVASLLALAACADARSSHAVSKPGPGVGRTEVVTLPLDPGLAPRSATYTPSGRVLASYSAPGDDALRSRKVKLMVVDQDGRNGRTFFSQTLPERPKG